MDGTWNTIVDPYEGGVGSHFYANRKAKDKQDLVEYNFDASEKLKVPGAWNTQRPSLFLHEGPLWYQRYFPHHKRPHTRVFLYFGAANYLTRVWLNGIKLGEHLGNFTPFNFEITDTVTLECRTPASTFQKSMDLVLFKMVRSKTIFGKESLSKESVASPIIRAQPAAVAPAGNKGPSE
ncbi:MAG: hypothetical protein LAO22_04995 [Acidobacteriia bacterium]|nr:hypothetical protein [Terriglobia bacterium]